MRKEYADGAAVHLGAEVAFGGGLAAVAAVWRRDDGRVAVRAHVFAAKNEPTPAHQREAAWRRRVSTEAVEALIVEWCKTYKARSVAYDPLELRVDPAQVREHGATFSEVRIGSSETKVASRRLYGLISNEELAHSGDEVLRAHMLAAQGEWDGDGRLAVRRGRQDAGIAAWYAVSFALIGVSESPSVYERRGVVVP